MDKIVGVAPKEVIAENAKVVAGVTTEKLEGLKFLIGQGMKKSKGSADPVELEKALRKLLLS